MKRKTEAEVRSTPFALEKWLRDMQEFRERCPPTPEGFTRDLEGNLYPVPAYQPRPGGTAAPTRTRRRTRHKAPTQEHLLITLGLLAGKLLTSFSTWSDVEGAQVLTAMQVVWNLSQQAPA